MGRKILSIVLGLIAGGVGVALIEGVSSVLHPPPPELDFSDREAMGEFVATLPPLAFLLVLVAHAIGAFVVGLVCTLVYGRRFSIGVVIAAMLLLCGGILNLVMIPHPLWFSVADVVIYLPSALVGAAVAQRRLPRHAAADPAEDASAA